MIRKEMGKWGSKKDEWRVMKDREGKKMTLLSYKKLFVKMLWLLLVILLVVH